MNRHKHGLSLILLFFIFIGCSQKQSLDWVPFNWEGDTISGQYIEKAYIYVPVKIDGLPYDLRCSLIWERINPYFMEIH